ncbi:MAG: phosphoribosyltransferase [Bacillota bacterium]
MYFDDRRDAARQLADALRGYAGTRPLVLAIPRGAVPMGRLIADRLGGELDVVLVRKLGAPGNREFAIGAIDECGHAYVPAEIADYGIDPAYIRDEEERQLSAIRRRREQYSGVRAPIDPAGRTVIVVDDGLATGATMIAALKSVRSRKPARLVCAVPVASAHGLGLVKPFADDTVCLSAPPLFAAVSQFYRDFPQVDDDEVATLLARPSIEAHAA